MGTAHHLRIAIRLGSAVNRDGSTPEGQVCRTSPLRSTALVTRGSWCVPFAPCCRAPAPWPQRPPRHQGGRAQRAGPTYLPLRRGAVTVDSRTEPNGNSEVVCSPRQGLCVIGWGGAQSAEVLRQLAEQLGLGQGTNEGLDH